MPEFSAKPELEVNKALIVNNYERIAFCECLQNFVS